MVYLDTNLLSEVLRLQVECGGGKRRPTRSYSCLSRRWAVAGSLRNSVGPARAACQTSDPQCTVTGLLSPLTTRCDGRTAARIKRRESAMRC